VATLTFVYSDSTAVVGPLATAREPHSWDLCVGHAGRITAPRGWELVRYSAPLTSYPEDDDLVALADAVREGGQDRVSPAGGWNPPPGAAGFTDPDGYHPGPHTGVSGGALPPSGQHGGGNGRRRGHLRVLPDPSD
jgi:hypothetical protein